MAGQIVDTLITRYELDAKGYEDGAKKILSATSSLGGAMTAVTSGLTSLLGSLGPVGIGLAAVAGGIGAVVVGEVALAKVTIDLGKSAIEAAADFERMAATIGGALGDMTKGKDVMEGLMNYAEASQFQLKDLAESATTLVAGKMDVSKYLPVIERFATVISGINPDGLRQVTGALLRMKGGSFGEAMEIFRRAGISNQDLVKGGLNVSKDGQIQGSPGQVLGVISKLSEALIPIIEAVKATSGVKISNFGDAIFRAEVALGKALQFVVPVIEKFSGAINDFVKSGGMEAIGSAIEAWVNSFVDIKNIDFEGLLIKAAGGAVALYTAASVAAEGLVALTSSMKGLVGWVEEMNKWKAGPLGRVVHLINDTIDRKNAERAGQKAPDTRPLDVRVKEAYEKTVGELSKKIAEEKIKQFENGMASGKSTVGNPLKTPDDTDNGKKNPVEPVLHKIEENTRNTKDLMKRLMFGHGAGMGVNPISMSSHAKRASTRHGQDLGMLLSGIIDERVFQAMTEARGMA